MDDLEFADNNAHKSPNKGKGWNDDRFFAINYIVIAVLNVAQFSLTIYGRHKLDTDYDHDDLAFANWNALYLCLAVACLTWVALAYGVIRRSDEHDQIIPCFAAANKWDQVIVNGIIWTLQLSAAATQTAFVSTYFHCVVTCNTLNTGSLRRNTAYEVLAWLLSVAWTPQFVWSLWYSREMSK